MHVGLIGGIGPAATDFYYRTIIDEVRSTGDELELTIVHADTPTLLSNQQSNNVEAQVKIYERLTQRLKQAGAQAVAITSIAGHFCIGEFSHVSPLPVIDMLPVVRQEIAVRGLKRVGLLGTRTVMESRFYGALTGVTVFAPPADLITEVHDTYISIAQSGQCSPEQRTFFHTAGQRMVDNDQLDTVMLAGTDLALAFNDASANFDVFDCARVHALSIAAVARR